MDITTRATNVINQLKETYLKDQTAFDFYVSQYITGANNKQLRQEITKQLTGENRPISRCGMYAVSDVMKAAFSQYTLF